MSVVYIDAVFKPENSGGFDEGRMQMLQYGNVQIDGPKQFVRNAAGRNGPNRAKFEHVLGVFRSTGMVGSADYASVFEAGWRIIMIDMTVDPLFYFDNSEYLPHFAPIEELELGSREMYFWHIIKPCRPMMDWFIV